MESFFAIIGIVAVLWLALRWFKLVWFRTKTLKVITEDLQYKPAVPGFQTTAFKSVTRAARANRWNECDAAIAFMLVQLGALPRPLEDDSQRFYIEKIELLLSVATRSTVGRALIEAFLAEQRPS